MTDNPEAAREEYLSFLQGLYGSEVIHPTLPESATELEELLRGVMKAQVVPDRYSDRILEHARRSFESKSHGDGRFLTADGYVRREADKVLAAFGEDTRRRIHNNVTFGSLPLPDLNGMCIKVPEGGYLILMNFGTLAFCEILANVLTGVASFEEAQKDSQPEFSLDRAAGYLLEMISTFPNISNVTSSRYAEFRNRMGHSTFTKNHFCSSFGDALTNFVIAHEVSHFVGNHVNGGLLRTVPIGPSAHSDTTVEAIHYQRLQEFEADVLGSGILVIGAENTGSQLDAMAAMIATQAFLLSLSLMEHVQNLEEPSHPPAEERRQHLLRELDYSDDAMKVISFYENGVFDQAKTRAAHRAKALELAQSANSLSTSGCTQKAADCLGEAATVAAASGDVSIDVKIRTARASALMKLNQHHGAIEEYQRGCPELR